MSSGFTPNNSMQTDTRQYSEDEAQTVCKLHMHVSQSEALNSSYTVQLTNRPHC